MFTYVSSSISSMDDVSLLASSFVDGKGVVVFGLVPEVVVGSVTPEPLVGIFVGDVWGCYRCGFSCERVALASGSS